MEKRLLNRSFRMLFSLCFVLLFSNNTFAQSLTTPNVVGPPTFADVDPALFSVQGVNLTQMLNTAPSPYAQGYQLNPNNGGAQNPLYFTNLKFSYDLATTPLQPAGFAGGVLIPGVNEIWVSRWATDTLIRLDLAGNFIDTLLIPGLSGVRGMTLFGPNVVASNASSTLTVIDPITRTVIGTINIGTTAATARFAAFDASLNGGAGGFWIGDFNTDIVAIDVSGNPLDTIPAANLTNFGGRYGAVVDDISAGGPYLWLFYQGGTPSNSLLTRLQIPTLAPTGLLIDMNAKLGSTTGIAGGCFIDNGNIQAGVNCIGGVLQGGASGDDEVFGIELSDSVAQDVGVTAITGPVGGACSYGANTPITVTVSNLSIDSVSNIPVFFQVNGGVVVVDTLTDTIPPANGVSFTFATGANMSGAGPFVINAWTGLSGDADAANDSSSVTITTSGGTISPPLTLDPDAFADGNQVFPNWTNTANFTPWQVNIGGTSSTATGPTGDAPNNGGGNYIYMETSGAAFNDSSVLLSECVDLGVADSAKLSYYYHMYGATIGLLRVEIIAGGVATTERLYIGQQQTANADPWIADTIDLNAYVGQVVQVRITGKVGTTGSTFNSDISLDDINLFQFVSFDDVGVSAITEPSGACGLSASTVVSVDVSNFTNNPITNIPVFYQIDQGVVVIDTVKDTIPGFGTVNFTFATNANLSSSSGHTLTAWTGLSTDLNAVNDSSSESFSFSALPIGIDPDTFATGNTIFPKWDNTLGQRVWQVNTGGTSSTATGPTGDAPNNGGGNYIYMETSGSAFNDEAILLSECFNLDPSFFVAKLEFYYHMYGATIGELRVEAISVNGVDTLLLLAGPQQTANADPWTFQEVDLSAYLGMNLQLQITGKVGTVGNTFDSDISLDDIRIVGLPAFEDVSITALEFPTSSNCGLPSSIRPIINVENTGSLPITNIPFNYEFDGDTVGIPGSGYFTVILADTLFPGEDSSFQLAFPVGPPFSPNPSVAGPHTLKVWSFLAADTVQTNDTLVATFVTQAPISTFPFVEDFESGQNGWGIGGGNSSWAFGTPAKNTIIGAASGVNAFVTGGLGTGTYSSNEDSYVESPFFDFSSLIAPRLEIDVWWNSEFSWDGANVQYSSDFGDTWNLVGNFGDPDNWYTDNTINGAPGGSQEGWTGRASSGNGSGGWVTAEHALDGLAGQSCVALRVYFGSDASVQDDGFAFDNIRIADPPAFDLGVTSVDSLDTGCNLSDSSIVSVTIENFGLNEATGFAVLYELDGGIPVSETYLDTLQTGATGVFTFMTPADLSGAGIHEIVAYSKITNDGNALNDTTTFTLNNFVASVNTYPYLESFEMGTAGWTSGGTNSTWGFGTPAKTTIIGAFDGDSAWVTGTTGSGTYLASDNSYVQSPVFDATPLCNPVVSLAIWYETEFSFDGANLQFSTDAGASWNTVGALNAPVNWYNDGSISGLAFTGSQLGWSGSSGGWVQASHPIPGIIGQECVIFRLNFGSDGSGQDEGVAFDYFGLGEGPTDNIGITQILSPTSFCNLGASETVSVEITNFGSNDVSGFNVGFAIDTNMAVLEAFTDTIPCAGVDTFTFTTTADLSAFGTYLLTTFTALAADTVNANDTATANVENIEPISMPFTQDFDTFPEAVSTFPNFFNDPSADLVWETEAGTTTSSATGPQGDAPDNGPGIYLYMETSSPATFNDQAVLRTNCIDISPAPPATGAQVSFWYHMHGAAIGFLQLEVETANGTDTLLTINGPQQSSETDSWQQAVASLNAYVGQSIVLVWRGAIAPSGTFAFESDIAIDLFEISPLFSGDAGVSNIIAPTDNCVLSASESITVEVNNFGSDTLTNVPIFYTINGGVAIVDTVPGPIFPLTPVQFTFSTAGDFSTFGTYDIVAYTANPPDPNNGNDTSAVTVTNITPDALPFGEDFDSYSEAVTSFLTFTNIGTLNWETEAGTSPSGSTGPQGDAPDNGSGNYVYIETNTGSIGDQAVLQSNCLDLTPYASTDSIELEFWYHMYGSAIGTLQVEVLTLGGALDTLFTISGQQQLDELDPWTQVILGLNAYAGQVIFVQFRGDYAGTTFGDMAIDLISVSRKYNIDAAMASIDGPLDGCPLGLEMIDVTITNAGIDTLMDIPVNYVLDGATAVNDTVFGILPPGDSTSFTFAVLGDFSAPGNHTLDVYTTYPGDQEAANDTINGNVLNSTIVAPYTEDFESFVSLNTHSTTNPGTYANGWTDGGGDFPWIVDFGGTSSSSTGPFDDHTPSSPAGQGNYLYTEASTMGTNDSALIVSPCVDISQLGCAGLTFWYHMFGAAMGDLHVDLWDGTQWILDITPPIIGQQQTSQSDPYLQRIVDLSPYQALGTIQIRFRGFDRSTTFTSDIAIDDVAFQNLNSVGVSAIISPSDATCELDTSETVTVEVTNFSVCDTIFFSDIDLTLNVSGPIASGPITENMASNGSGGIPPLGTALYTFNTGVNMSAGGTYTIDANTMFATDTNPTDDAASGTAQSYGVVNTFPYQEGFEAGDGGWFTTGTNSSWELGAPNFGILNTAAEGANSWMTNLTGQYNANELSYVESPCFDLSGFAADPVLKFAIGYNIEAGFDGASVQYSTDDGTSWTKLGTAADGFNWYNNATNDEWDDISTGTGSVMTQQTALGSRPSLAQTTNFVYREAAHLLDGLAGQSSVRLRFCMRSDGTVQRAGVAFDDVRIQDAPVVPCGHDGYEPNDNMATAANLMGGAFSMYKDAGICMSGDDDYYFINNSVAGSNITVSLKDQPVDLDFRILFNGTPTDTSSTGSTANESITITGAAVGTYYVHVYGPGGNWSTDNYTLNVSTTAPSTGGTKPGLTNPVVKTVDVNMFQAYPNPTEGDITLKFYAQASGAATVIIRDLLGKAVVNETMVTDEGINVRALNLDKLTSGTYMIEVKTGDQAWKDKIVILED